VVSELDHPVPERGHHDEAARDWSRAFRPQEVFFRHAK